jgi:hypothetical protein
VVPDFTLFLLAFYKTFPFTPDDTHCRVFAALTRIAAEGLAGFKLVSSRVVCLNILDLLWERRAFDAQAIDEGKIIVRVCELTGDDAGFAVRQNATVAVFTKMETSIEQVAQLISVPGMVSLCFECSRMILETTTSVDEMRRAVRMFLFVSQWSSANEGQAALQDVCAPEELLDAFESWGMIDDEEFVAHFGALLEVYDAFLPKDDD